MHPSLVFLLGRDLLLVDSREAALFLAEAPNGAAAVVVIVVFGAIVLAVVNDAVVAAVVVAVVAVDDVGAVVVVVAAAVVVPWRSKYRGGGFCRPNTRHHSPCPADKRRRAA